MNARIILTQLGVLLMVLSGSILAIACWSGIQALMGAPGESLAFRALGYSAFTGAVLGLGLWLGSKKPTGAVGRKEALLLVAVSWLLAGALCALPYRLWAEFAAGQGDHDPAFGSYVNCYFEAMSGLTTTGATVLTDIASLPRSMLLWRSLTHWLGGLGIVVLFVAVLPMLGVGGKRLFKVEAPGPTSEGVKPRIQETARALWIIYLGLTFAEILLLWVFGLDLFESVCHTFATLATGGFSTRGGSVGEINSLSVDVVLIVFMVLAGINFGLYYAIWRGHWRNVWKDPELRAYLGFMAIASAVIVGFLWDDIIVTSAGQQAEPSFGSALRHGVFQVVSIQTTTGYCTANFDLWPFVPKAILLGLMFVGGCGGSTGGGIKVARIVIMAKVLWAEIERVFRPNVVRPIRMGKTTIDPELRQGVTVYVLIILIIFALGTFGLMVLERSAGLDITTAATACVATLNNIGPGLARVGAIENFGWFSDGSKILMSLLMALGRLEVYALLVLFVPTFWRGE